MVGKMKLTTTVMAMLMIFGVASLSATDLQASLFDQELTKVRYGLDETSTSPMLAAVDAEADLPLSAFAQTEQQEVKYKSPAKAFVYSLAVPGLGQYYYGSKIKPVIFLAIEVFGWANALKFHGNGNDLTAAYETFNRAHWFRARYEEYLEAHYGSAQPDTIPDTTFPELVEVLPQTETQQYFEMTGKYDQFAWGWDDAIRDDQTWADFREAGTYPEKIIKSPHVPYSANRILYEDKRDAANNEYSKSLRFVFAIMANHLVSAFEAYFTTKHHNNQLRHDQEFARLRVSPELRSYSSWKDTPYVTLSFKF